MRRRRFLHLLANAAAGAVAGPLAGCPERRDQGHGAAMPDEDALTLFLCGDLMLGRAIDQLLPHPSDPVLYEPVARDARAYLRLAAERHGAIARPVDWRYVWGDALDELARRRPAARIVNLETSVTRHDVPWPGKTIQYRMHPANVPVLEAAGIDGCVLANNHVLDWSRPGLDETLATLHGAGLATAGAGSDLAAAQAPAVLPVDGGGRVLVFAAATGDSGVPPEWAATATRSGVHRLPDLSASGVARIAELVRAHRRGGDRVVFSIHWGGNWDYAVAAEERACAHALIDQAGVDVVHGHSSHHAKGIEVHGGRLVLYGCGDFLDDYEGIAGYEAYRGDLGAMYFPTLGRDGALRALTLVPTRIRRMRVERATGADRDWLLQRLRRECARFDSTLAPAADGSFALRW